MAFTLACRAHDLLISGPVTVPIYTETASLVIQNTNTEYEYRVRNPCQHWESDPIQNTEYEYRIRKPRQTVTARECCRPKYRIRNTNTAYESCTKPYRLDLATALTSTVGRGSVFCYRILYCVLGPTTLSPSTACPGSVERVSQPRIPYSVFCITVLFTPPDTRQTEYEYEEYNTIRNMY